MKKIFKLTETIFNWLFEPSNLLPFIGAVLLFKIVFIIPYSDETPTLINTVLLCSVLGKLYSINKRLKKDDK